MPAPSAIPVGRLEGALPNDDTPTVSTVGNVVSDVIMTPAEAAPCVAFSDASAAAAGATLDVAMAPGETVPCTAFSGASAVDAGAQQGSEESSDDEERSGWTKDKGGWRRTDLAPPPPQPTVPKIPMQKLEEAIASAREMLMSQESGPSCSGAAFSGARVAKAPPVLEAKAANATHEAGGRRAKDEQVSTSAVFDGAGTAVPEVEEKAALVEEKTSEAGGEAETQD